MDIAGGAYKIFHDNFIISNASGGLVDWSGAGDLKGYNGGSIQNAGTFLAHNDQTIHFLNTGTRPVFNNTGTFRKKDGTGTTVVEFAWDGNGTVDVQSGTLQFVTDGTLKGDFVAETGGIIDFRSGLYSVNGATFSGNSQVVADGATLSLDGPGTVTGQLLFSAGTLTGTGALEVDGKMIWSDGDWSGTGTVRVANLGELDIAGGAVKAFHGGFTIQTDAGGSIKWTDAGDIHGYDGGTIQNDGLFEIANDQTFDYRDSGAVPVFNNSGTLRKTGGPGTTVMEFAFNNAGALDVQAGTILFPNGATFGGSATVTGAGLAKFTGGNLVVNQASFQNVEVAGGTFTLNGTLTSQNTIFSGGMLTGAGSVANKLIWTGGTLDGPGSLTILNGATLEISGPGDKQFQNGFVILNDGSLQWLEGTLNGLGGPEIQNKSDGVFEISDGLLLKDLGGRASPLITNDGILTKNGAFATANLEADMVNTGILDLGLGQTLALSGNYVTQTGATLRSKLGPGLGGTTALGQLAVGGTAQLAGTLELDLSNVNFQGGSYDLMAYGAATGVFDGINYQNVVGGTSPQVYINPATVVVVSPNPPTISDIPDKLLRLGGSSGPLPFTVGDAVTPAANLTLSASTSDSSLIPLSGINFGGSGAARTVSVNAAAGQGGVATVTVTVMDEFGLTASDSFVVSVNPVTTPSTILGANLLANGDAEAGAASPDTVQLVTAPGWRTQGGFNVLAYGSPIGFPDGASPGPTSRGNNFFAGGPNNTQSAAYQVIALFAAGARIDAGIAHFRLSAFLGGATGEGDNMTVTATFLDVDGTELGTSTIGPVTDPDRGGVTGLLNRSAIGTIPVGARYVEVAMVSTKTFGTYNDGYADNLSFLIGTPPVIGGLANSTVPENSSATINFTLADTTTPLDDIILTATTSNGGLLPVQNLVFGGSGANRSLQLTPLPDQSGAATITIFADNGLETGSSSFIATVSTVNEAPVVLQANVSTAEDTSLNFPVSDLLLGAFSGLAPGLVADYFSDTAFTSPAFTRIENNVDFPDMLQTVSGTVLDGDPAFSARLSGVIIPEFDETCTFRATSDAGVRLIVDGQTLIDNLAPHTATDDTGQIALLAGHAYLISIDYVEDLGAPAVLQLRWSSPSLPEEIVPASRLFHDNGETSQNLTVTAVDATTPAGGTINIVGGQLTYTPPPDFSGTDSFHFTVQDNGTTSGSPDPKTTQGTVQIVVTPVNDRPTISPVANFSVNEDDAIPPVSFTVADVDNAAGSLVVTAHSSNQGIVQDAGLNITGVAGSRQLEITQVPNASGTVTITLTVDDGALNASTSFALTIFAVNDAPTITGLADFSVAEDSIVPTVNFILDDVDNPLTGVTAHSSNQSLVNDADLVTAGIGGNWTLDMTLVPNAFGSTTITLSSTDDSSATGSSSFVLTVTPVNDPPTISPLANNTVNEDATIAPLNFTVADIDSPVASLTVTAHSSDQTLVPDANLSVTGAGSGRQLGIVLAPNANGTATIQLTVSDGALSASTSFQLTVNPVNDPPTITSITDFTVAEDATITPVAFTVGDIDSPVGSLAVTATSSNTGLVPNANLKVNGSGANRTLDIALAPNENGSSTITLTVSDGSLGSLTAFLLTVTPVDDPPTVSTPANVTVNEDSPVPTVSFTVNDIDSPVAGLTVGASSSDQSIVKDSNLTPGGSGANRTLDVLLEPNANGVVTITLKVSDGALITSTSFQLTVTPVNDPPTITSVTDFAVTEDATIAPVDFTVGDIDSPVGSLTITATSSNTGLVPDANLSVTGSGASRQLGITLVPNANGSTIITLKASDGALNASTSFNLTVTAVDDPPTIAAIADVTVFEDVPSVPVSVSVNDIDDPVAGLTVTGKSSNQLLVPDANISAGGSGSSRTLTLVPLPNANGSATITVTVDDGQMTASTAFLLKVTAVNDAPQITVANTPLAVNEDTPLALPAIVVSDVDAGAGFLHVEMDVQHGTLTFADTTGLTFLAGTANGTDTLFVEGLLADLNAALADVTYLGDPDYTGPDTFFVEVDDLGNTGSAFGGTSLKRGGPGKDVAAKPKLIPSPVGLTGSQFIDIDVQPVNDAPRFAVIANQSMIGDQSLTVPFVVTDPDSSLATLAFAGASGNPALLPPAGFQFAGSGTNRTVTITPVVGQSGVATVTLSATDASSATGTTQFQLTVIPPNTPPTVAAVANQFMDEDTTLNVNLTVGDLETPVAALAIQATSSNQLLLPDANITLTGNTAARVLALKPAPDQNGSATVTMKLTDSGGLSTTRSFVVTVNPVNDAPAIVAIPGQTTFEDSGAQAYLVFISDVDNAPESLVLGASSSNQSLVPDANISFSGTGPVRSIILAAQPDASGTAVITVTVSDGQLSSFTAFNFNVAPVNDPPVIGAIPDQKTDEDKPLVLAVTVSDSDTPATALVLSATSTNPALVPDGNITFGGSGGNRTMIVSPAADQFGTTQIKVSVKDDIGSLAFTVFNLVVAPVNDPPVISGIADQTIPQGGTSGAIPFTIGDVDNTAADLTLSATSTVTGVVPVSGIVFGGTGTNRTVTINSSASHFGNTTITLNVSDGQLTTSTSFQVAVQFVNQLPEITSIADQVIPEDGASAPLSFAVADLETPDAQLTVTAKSSDQTLIPDANIVVSGSGFDRKVTVAPATNQFGSANITLSVADTDGGVTASSFTVTVQSVNDLPTISAVDNVTATAGTTNAPVAFTVGDVETPADQIVVTAASSNPALIPVAGVVLAGSGANRTVAVIPAAELTGSAEVTLIATDADNGSASRSFSVTVTAALPVIQVQPLGQTVKEKEPVTLSVKASGLGLTYQWQRNDEDLPGETKADLAFPSASVLQGGRYNARVINATGGSVTSAPAILRVVVPPTIANPPASQTVVAGQSVTFSVSVNGSAPLSYQWQHDEKDILGAVGQVFGVEKTKATDAGKYRVLVSNDGGNVTSADAVLIVQEPPSITGQPKSQTVQVGQSVTFTVDATGNGLSYQWRLNGVNIDGETNKDYTILSVKASNSGSYTVVVSSPSGTATSDPAVLTVVVPVLTIPDNYVERVLLPGSNGSIQGDNTFATAEPGEPQHAGHPAQKSVWAKWVAPANGIVVFSTTGSSFDTRLAAYEGQFFQGLFTDASDEDSGGFLTSEINFTAVAGVEYSIAVDGFGGASGTIVLSWSFNSTAERTPRIKTYPQDTVVARGADAVFTVVADDATGYLWFHNGSPLLTERASTLTVRNVNDAEVGLYLVEVSNGSHIVRTGPARLQINITENGTANPGITTEDKFKNATQSGSAEGFQTAGIKGKGPRPAGGALARGYTGTQIFNTYGSTTEAGEPNHCGVIGGASQWYTYRAEADGTLEISTAGSDFDTILAVYTGPGTDFDSLLAVACDDNGGPNGLTSLLQFPAVSGTTYYIAVDGNHGATGTVKLSYKLSVPLRFNASSVTSLGNGQFRLQLTGAQPGAYTIQSTTNMVDWRTLFATNTPTGVITVTDTNAASATRSFYRAVFEP
ncbi:MAG TPA: tandem-95 repeat protein [Verrucomicrobiae bacterium]|nr:tandem-95 repeat protein [Verrucomicrobiae bacterium]